MAPSKELKRLDADVAKVDPAQTLQASKALLRHMKELSEAAAASTDKPTKKSLLASSPDGPSLAETPIWLTLTTKQHIKDSNRLKPGKIALPFSLNEDASRTVCLITADPQRAYKNAVASAQFPEELRKRITRVIGVEKLRAKFSQYEAQRQLAAEHDVFLGDDRIIGRLPKLLGKAFYKSTAKRPIPVVLSAPRPKGPDGKLAKRPKKKKGGDEGADGEITSSVNVGSPAAIAAEISKALSSALVHLSPSNNTAVRVAWADWPADRVAANVEAVATALVAKWVPDRWDNVRSIFVKGPDTMPLPIWQTGVLWKDGAKDVVKDGSDEAKLLQEKKMEREAGKEKANVGRKRKLIEAPVAEEKVEKEPKAKKAKVKESNDDNLDKQIVERKASLKKQKSAAKKAVEA